MSNNIVPSIETLPVELLHRIFDNLDAKTILLSVRSVSRLFRLVINTYDRYVLDFKSISKSNFYVLCRLINPQNVISLKLSNNGPTSDQIDLFISLVRLRQFTRLRSLTLLDVDEGQLNFILKRINLNLLTSFSFNIKKYDDRRTKTTNNLLPSIFAQSSFRKMEFDIKTERMSKISWPINCTIQYLIINEGVTMDTLFTILQCSPHLHTIILKHSFHEIINNITITFSLPMYFRQLTSLTIERLDVKIDKLESFLLLTPSLVHLKLIGRENMLDGKRWEQFIAINLPNLDKFEFYFDEWNLGKKTSADIELIISSFRTPFWIEHKKWFVTCEYRNNWPNTIHLYSIPICKSFLTYEVESEKISLSTYTMTMGSDSSIQNNVNSLHLSINKALAYHLQEKKAMATQFLFPSVTEITIDADEEWSIPLLQSFSILINISQIVHLILNSYEFNEYNQNILMNIRSFIEQAHNLSSLIIRTSFYRCKLTSTIENIHSIVPRHVKHLQIPISSVDQIKIILNRCDHLSTIKFDIRFSKYSQEVIKWFTDNTINSTCSTGFRTVSIWLGKRRIQTTEINGDQKRIKLTDNN